MRRPRWSTLVTAAATLAVASALLTAVGPQHAPVPAADAAAAGTSTRGPAGLRSITDDRGRTLVLRGLNTASSAKNDPSGLPWITEPDVQRESERLGSNFVRFLIQWRTVEPSPGRYDERYLDRVAERVAWYGRRGYHVMLDMHQDLYGPAVAGNGAPPWATDSDGLPSTAQEMWELTYLQPGNIRAFDNFWGTGSASRDLRGHYVRAWRRVAERFAREPAVLGYDLMNEPWGGSLPSPTFEAGPLAQLYRRATAAIREVDKDGWIFVEPAAISTNWGLPSALPYLHDPRRGPARIAYAPHLYPLPMDLGGGYTGGNRQWIDRTLRSWRGNALTTARRLDAPLLLGEFGTEVVAEPTGARYAAAVMKLADGLGIGTAYWSNDPGGWAPWTKGWRPTPLQAVLDRPYPRAVAGRLRSYAYNPTRKSFTLAWDQRRGSTGPSELRLPAEDFPYGGRVRAANGERVGVRWDADRRILYLTADPSAARHSVTVTPARTPPPPPR